MTWATPLTCMQVGTTDHLVLGENIRSVEADRNFMAQRQGAISIAPLGLDGR